MLPRFGLVCRSLRFGRGVCDTLGVVSFMDSDLLGLPSSPLRWNDWVGSAEILCGMSKIDDRRLTRVLALLLDMMTAAS